MDRQQENARHDPFKRRKAQRHGREKGVRINLSAAELRLAGIDPDGPPPEYRVWPDRTKKGGVRLRLYT
jgi:hypothetical protein